MCILDLDGVTVFHLFDFSFCLGFKLLKQQHDVVQLVLLNLVLMGGRLQV